jgi:hypothetical protein
MPGAKSSGSKNDEFGHGLIVSDIERIFQMLANEPNTIININAASLSELFTDADGTPSTPSGLPVGYQTIDVCVDGVAMKMDIVATVAYTP